MRYRVDVVAADVADVVKFAGGWLFDRAMAGWDVTVLLVDHPDERPLQILGAHAPIVQLRAVRHGGEQHGRSRVSRRHPLGAQRSPLGSQLRLLDERGRVGAVTHHRVDVEGCDFGVGKPEVRHVARC